VLIIKGIEFHRLLGQARAADAALASGRPIEESLAALPHDGPFHTLVACGLDALKRHESGQVESVDRHTWLSLSLSRAVGRVLARFSGGLALLATIASTAPFVGLFGTVWSIHHALAEIGLSGQASIERVAGPVGESLVMTALGLAVAVPAVLAHNGLVRRQKSALDAVRGFSADLHALLLSGGRARDKSARPSAAVAPVLASVTR
jgi:biopolymer transport protein ExbB